MKKNKKENIIVNVENVKTRSGWNGVKPYTRITRRKSCIPGKAVVTGRRLSYEQNLLESEN